MFEVNRFTQNSFINFNPLKLTSRQLFKLMVSVFIKRINLRIAFFMNENLNKRNYKNSNQSGH